VWAARRFAAVPLQSVALGIVVSSTLLVLALAIDVPHVLLFLPLAYAGMLAGTAAGLIWAPDHDRGDGWKFALFSVVVLVPIGLLAGVIAGRTGDGKAVAVLAAAVAFGSVLRIVDERSVDLGGAGPTSAS